MMENVEGSFDYTILLKWLRLLDIIESDINQIEEINLDIEIDGMKLIIPESIHLLTNLKKVIFNANLEGFHNFKRCINLVNLEYIDGKTKVFPYSLDGFEHIKSLKLAGGLRSFPQDIFKLHEIIELDVWLPNLEMIPDISCFKRLEVLRLDTNNSKVPDSIYMLSKLKHLSLNTKFCITTELDNIHGLESFSLSIESFKQLSFGYECLPITNRIKEISIYGHQLPVLPNWFMQCKLIEKIDFLGLSMVKIPEYFIEFSKLRYLTLQNCEINEIPKWIIHLKCLEFLDLTCNNIEVIPTVLNELINLKTVVLRENPISNLDESHHFTIQLSHK